jgi:small subunit ribosomal protein S1
VRVRILEIDEERRRISLSIKRATGQGLPLRDVQVPEPAAEPGEPAADVPELGLSEEVFSEAPPAQAPAEAPAEDSPAEPPPDE